MRTNISMPKDFPKRIHHALKYWHAQHGRGVLDDLVLAQQLRATRTGTSPRLITNEILIDALDQLRLVDAHASDLLQRRFPNQETARSIAYKSNMTEDVIYQHQRTAIAQLAKIVWAQELELRYKRAQDFERHLESPTYTRLFGADHHLAEIRSQVENPAEPWILSIEGMGGIGKTALADALTRLVASGTRFRGIAWITARQTYFRLSQRITAFNNKMTLTPTDLIDQLILQFNLVDLRPAPEPERYAGVKSYLKSRPCLVILDNLETVTEYWSLIPYLRELATPSKFLITTRYSLQGESGVYIHKLETLSRADTLALVRHEAAIQGLHDLAMAGDPELEPIYDVTGGNPLAVKLVIGHTHTFPLYAVLDRLKDATGQVVEELLTFIHANAWTILDPDSQRVLLSMLCTDDEGGRLEQIASSCELEVDSAVTCLQHLAILSLISVKGNVCEKRYALHSLTRAFLAHRCMQRDHTNAAA